MDYFKNDFLFLGMKFATKSILGPKWELTQNVGMKWVLMSILRFSWFSCFISVLDIFSDWSFIIGGYDTHPSRAIVRFKIWPLD